MSSPKKGKRAPAAPDLPEEEESEGALAPSQELEDALREAAEAVDARARAKHDQDAADDPAEAPAPPSEAGADPVAAGLESDDVEVVRAGLQRAQDRFIRLQADFENFRRRSLKERQEAHRYGSENLVKDLLETVDNLERAIGHARKSGGGDLESLLHGVELVHRELFGILDKHHVTEVAAEGQAFDPAVHEAMSQIPDGSVAPNTVLEVLQRGFQLRDRLIRPARVVVARAPENEQSSGEGEAAD